MKKTLALALALATAPFAASGAELSYTFVEGGWNRLSVDDNSAGDPDLDGGYVRGSFDLGAGFNVIGSASRVSEDYTILGLRTDVDLTQYELGLGYHQGVSDQVDFIAELAYNRVELDVDVNGVGSDDESVKGGRGALGLRTQFNDVVEGSLKANYYDGGDFEGTWTGVVGAQFKFSPMWGVTAEIEHGELVSNNDDTRYSIGVRASF
jgi:hypothetical protein